jgi:hypothetical protein
MPTINGRRSTAHDDPQRSHVVLPLVFGAFGAVLGTGAAFWLMSGVMAAGGWTSWRRMKDEHPPRR